MQEFKTGGKISFGSLFRVSFFVVSVLTISFLSAFVLFLIRQHTSGSQFKYKRSENPLIIDNLNKNPQEVKLFLAGDVMLGRTVRAKAYELSDFSYPFKKVADVMQSSDITFVNLENPIIENCPSHETGYVFCATPDMLDGLTFAGVDVVNLANNHTLNYGRSGLEDTLKYLFEKNILTTGVGKLVVLERSGVTFGFLGFDKSEQNNPKLTQDEIGLIIASDSEVDVLVVSMHWGVEYQNKALPGVRSLAKEIVSHGADVIVGHHPHWVQDWEFIDDKPVFYSLGNFIFDQMWSEETKKGLAVDLTYDKEGTLIEYQLLPTYMSSWSQPEFVEN